MQKVMVMSPVFSEIADEVKENLRKCNGLINKNIRINGKRTSIRLEADMWDVLDEVAAMENCGTDDICTMVYTEKDRKASFTAALRVFLLLYYRKMAMVKIVAEAPRMRRRRRRRG